MNLLDWWASWVKNKAIRSGKWVDADYEIDESAMSNALALVDAIRGKSIDSKYRDGWDNDIVGNGSQNHPLLGAACEFWYQKTRNEPKMNTVLNAWKNYALLHYMTSETYSSFIYGKWIHGAILTVAFGAKLVGRQDVSDALYAHLKIGYALWALGCSGDDWAGSNPGKAVVGAGSRAWISPHNGSYYDDNGVLVEPYNIDTTFATNFLAAIFGWAQPKGWFGDLVASMKTVDPGKPWGLSADDKIVLNQVALSTPDSFNKPAFDDLITRLKNSPVRPAIPCRIIKTDSWVGFVALKSIHPGSTSFKYGSFWFWNGRPDKLLWKKLWPNVDNRAGWLNFDPSVRKAGVHGSVEVTNDGSNYTFSGDREQAKTYSSTEWSLDDDAEPAATIPPDTYYDELLGGHRDPASYREGPRTLSLPYKKLVYDVEFGPDGVTVHYPEGNGNGNGDEEDCSEISNWLKRLWCYIKKLLGLG
jgi:hypothetical protein